MSTYVYIKVGKLMLCGVFFCRTEHKFLHKKLLLLDVYAYFFKKNWGVKFIYWGRNSNFKPSCIGSNGVFTQYSAIRYQYYTINTNNID